MDRVILESGQDTGCTALFSSRVGSLAPSDIDEVLLNKMLGVIDDRLPLVCTDEAVPHAYLHSLPPFMPRLFSLVVFRPNHQLRFHELIKLRFAQCL